jgi:HEAT repeat protein
LWELDARLLESLTQAMQDLDKVEDAALTAIRRLQDDALPTLIKLLRSEDRKVRRSASWALGELRDQAAAPGLVQMLYDADAMVSEEAGRALGLIRDEATIPWLIETLRHSNVRVRKSAARALGLIGESALKPLLEVMRDGNEMLSCLVAEALKEIRLPVVTEILLDLTRATSDEVRCAALEALDARRDPLVIQRLIECLADETMIPTGNKRICDVAARGLENIDTAEARNALEEWKMRQEIMFSQEDGKRGKTASTAKHRLKHITRPRTEPLPPLSDEIETATKPAAESHLAAPTPSLQPSAAPKSPEPAPVAPSQPIKRIKPVSPQQPTPVASKGEAPLDILNDLIANIKQDSAWGEREDVAKTLRKYTGTLGEYDTLNVVKRLEQELRDPDWVVRWATTEAMASVGNVQAVPALMSMVHDSNWTVRIAVVRSLLELGEASATEALLTLVNDKQSLVREAVAEALGVLRGPNAFTGVANLASDSEVFVRLAAVHTLHELEDAGAENMALAALDDEDAHIRWEAASVLGKIGTAAAVDKLALYLHDREGPYWENLKVCDLAALALEHIGTPKALALLEHWRSQQADRTQGV